MKTMKYISAIIGIALVLGACTERIDIELDSTYERLIVESQITTDTGIQYVRLTKSSDYYTGKDPDPVSNASVKLSDGFNTWTLPENSNKPGYYETNEDFYGETGITYSLDIELEETIGEHKSYSASSKIMNIGTIDSIRVEYNPDWEIYEVQIFALESPTNDFYMFEVLKNGELLTDSINKVWISDDRYFNGNYTMGALVGILDPENPRENPEPGDIITLKMSSITKDYYNFIIQLQDQTFQYRNPLFSGPPANVSTNIENAHGFFATYSTTYSSTIYQ
ncbi:MAG: DUF4249 domain-containing protein [Bacteroidetes bacterium]|nr:DUF4249 domain-containing protein [Bacteroidota bacterium]